MDICEKLLGQALKSGFYLLESRLSEDLYGYKGAYGSDCYFSSINFKQVHNKLTFIEQLETALDFPSSCEGNLDSLTDWLRDLSWLEYKPVIVFIYGVDIHTHKQNFDIRKVFKLLRDETSSRNESLDTGKLYIIVDGEISGITELNFSVKF